MIVQHHQWSFPRNIVAPVLGLNHATESSSGDAEKSAVTVPPVGWSSPQSVGLVYWPHSF